MSLETEQRLLEFGKWYDYHKKTITDVKKRSEFLETAVDNLSHLMIHFVEDIRVLEGRGPISRNVSNIITPDNMLKRASERKGVGGVNKIRPGAGVIKKPEIKDGKP